MNPLVPDALDVALNALLVVNALLATVAVWVVVRERKPLRWMLIELLSVVLVPLVGPMVVLWLRRRHVLGR